jgi:D-alanine-D-alanine ligase
MVPGPAEPESPCIADQLRTIIEQTVDIAPQVHLMFVTNIHDGELSDGGPGELSNVAQSYTRREADEIIRGFQALGVTVESFFSEIDFISAAIQSRRPRDSRHRLVFTDAESGTGSGRRALIPALCNLVSLPVLNSGAHACSLTRHKFHANAVLRRVGIRVPETWLFTDGAWLADLQPPEGSRVIIKPTYESMGIGVGDDSVRIVDASFHEFIRERAARFGQPTVVQEFITGQEVGVPLARLEKTYALEPVIMRQANGDPFGARPKTFLDENVNHNLSHAPFETTDAQHAALRDITTLAFDVLEMSGVARIDLRIDSDGRAYVIDTNADPPPVAGTCWAFAMQRLGFSVQEMPAAWLGICLQQHGLISGV